MIIGAIILVLLTILFFVIGEVYSDERISVLGGVCMLMTFILFIYGCFHGFINYPKTSGTHQGVITAVDYEGVIFRHYKIYLKSSGYTNQSDETEYCLYEYETDLIDKLNNSIGKQAKLHYGHDGGYIGFKSCGTYHIKDVEVIENE